MPDTSFTDYVTTIVSTWLNQANKLVFWGRRPNVATTTGSANAQILTLETGSLYSAGTEADGDEFVFIAGFSNAAAMTLQVLQPSGTNVARAVQLNGAALTGGEVIAGQPYRVTRKSTTWQLTSLAGTAFGTTLLQAANAAAARTTLGAAAAANTELTGTVALSGDLSPTQLTADQNDYNPTGLSGAAVLRLSTDASRNITGIQGGADGRILKLLNVGSFPIVLKTADTGSSAANRFDFDTDLTLQPDQGVVLYYDSTDSRWRAARTTNGEFRSVQVFTSTGANTWTKPAGLKRAKLTVVAGGGNAANVGGAGAGQVAVSGGAGAGGTAIKTVAAAALGSTETATVGAAAGASSFGSHCSATPGGASTAGGVGAYSSGAGGVGGIGSNGDYNIRGGPGMPGYADGVNVNVLSGSGGGSTLGGGAIAVVAATGNGNAGGAYGGGGSGAISYNGSGAANGGSGASGIIIVEEFF